MNAKTTDQGRAADDERAAVLALEDEGWRWNDERGAWELTYYTAAGAWQAVVEDGREEYDDEPDEDSAEAGPHTVHIGWAADTGRLDGPACDAWCELADWALPAGTPWSEALADAADALATAEEAAGLREAAATVEAAQDAATDAAAAAVRAATAARIEASADASTIELLAGSPVAAALREALADLASMATLASVSTLDEAQQHAEACRAACWSELDALTA